MDVYQTEILLIKKQQKTPENLACKRTAFERQNRLLCPIWCEERSSGGEKRNCPQIEYAKKPQLNEICERYTSLRVVASANNSTIK